MSAVKVAKPYGMLRFTSGKYSSCTTGVSVGVVVGVGTVVRVAVVVLVATDVIVAVGVPMGAVVTVAVGVSEVIESGLSARSRSG